MIVQVSSGNYHYAWIMSFQFLGYSLNVCQFKASGKTKEFLNSLDKGNRSSKSLQTLVAMEIPYCISQSRIKCKKTLKAFVGSGS